MSKLDDYLRGAYVADKRQMQLLGEIVGQVVPVFYHFWDKTEKTWPYQVSKGTSKVTGGISQSTHCMTLFMLEVLCNSIDGAVLVPAGKHPLDLKAARVDLERMNLVRDESKSKLIEVLKPGAGKKRNRLTASGTFGNDDPLTLTWLCELAKRWDAEDKATINPIRSSLSMAVAKTFRRAKSGAVLAWPAEELTNLKRTVYPNSFLNLRANLLAKAAHQAGLGGVSQPIKLHSFVDAIHTHLAYSSIPDSRFDPAELAFALEGTLQIEPHALGMTTILRIFDTLVVSQGREPYWRPVMPFVGTERGMVLFPVSVEIANSMLRSCEILDNADDPHFFSEFEPQLRRYFTWLQSRLERGKSGGRDFVGWHSEHVNELGTIHLWETVQVVLFLTQYAAMLQRKIAADGLREANLKARHPEILPDFWSDEPCLGFSETSRYRVVTTIHKNIVEKKASDGSILLYGPPGTGKTTIAEQMAAHLRRPLIIITVSDFLAGGAAEVEARAKQIFEVLLEQQNVIILLDEIDQFLLDRNGEDYKKQQGIFQFMTPGMLTKLQDLKDAKRSIFIVGTNYAERIDRAIKRQGRIEDRHLLNIPARVQRRKLVYGFLKKLRKASFTESRFEKAAISLGLDHATVFFGYGDLKYLVKYCGAFDKLSATRIVEKLIDFSRQMTASVNLGAYLSRLERDDLSNDELIEEFSLLLYLLAELESLVEPGETNRATIVRGIDLIVNGKKPATPNPDLNKPDLNKEDLNRFKTRISEVVKDSQVVDKLMKRLSEWKICGTT